ncbi:hypothetical protein KI387_016276, partial [Taxus chinensis]
RILPLLIIEKPQPTPLLAADLSQLSLAADGFEPAIIGSSTEPSERPFDISAGN